MVRRLLLVGSLSLVVRAAVASAAPPASVVPGETRSGDLVALGRDAEVAGTLRGTLVVVAGNARVTGRVEKDVVVLGGDVVLAEGAVVTGDVLAVGGEVSAAGGGVPAVGGRLLTVGELEAAFAAELKTSPLAAR